MPLKIYSEKDDHPSATIKFIVAVAAGKGGVGKSTVTVNLALALKERGMSVGILDADLYGPSIRRMLPEDRLPSQREKHLYPAYCHGIPMISMAYFRKEDEAAIVRAPIANSFIRQFLQNLVWGSLDILLIDFPPGTGDIQLTLSQEARLAGAVVVTTPQEVALMDVRKTVHLFDEVKVPLIGVIENMSYFQQGEEKKFIFGQGGGARLASEEGVPFIGEIPIDPEICRCGDQGLSLLEQNCQGADAFRAIAEKFLRHLAELDNPNLLQRFFVKSGYLHLEWQDGKKGKILLNELQKNCSCAACRSDVSKIYVKPDVTVMNILPVGTYAIKVEFNSGCSAGIYTYDVLERLMGIAS